MGKKCIGIDVGGTSVKIGLFETTGDLLLKWEVPTRKKKGGSNIIGDVAASILKTLEEKQIPMEEVVGAGLGVPGPVMPDGSVEVCVNLGWHNVNPGKELSALLGGLPVKSEIFLQCVESVVPVGKRGRLLTRMLSDCLGKIA